MFRILLFIFPLIFLSCSKLSLENRFSLKDSLALHSSLNSHIVATDTFKIFTLSRIDAIEKPIRFYIEGDGFAWENRYTPSSNPTPTNPVALELASVDSYPNIAYIARPCQYTDDEKCTVKYWTSHRFAKEVVLSINNAINELKKTPKQKIEIVGYSGGAAIAILLSEYRDDIAKIITVAGNIDHIALSHFHNISLLKGSLNPADYASNLKTIPHMHIVCNSDTIVPLQVTKSFTEKSGVENIIRIDNCTHETGWKDFWKNYANMELN